jgi:vanillate O-demethylase ferredoxin subunit
MKLLQKTRVVQTRSRSPRIREVVLEHQLRDGLQPFDAGAHVTLALPGGINRQYSLCSDPADSNRYRLGVLLTETTRGGSRAVHDLVVGDTLFVSYPGNSFPLIDNAEHVVFLAGGIGITPILSMVYALAAAGKPFEIHYGARSKDDLVFLDELKALCPGGALHLYVDDGPNGTRPDIATILQRMEKGHHLHACGPAPMLNALLETADKLECNPEQIHVEQFGAVAVGDRQGDPFEIELVGEDAIVSVSPHQSALEALRLAGHIVPSSCEGGICGECRLKFIDGNAVHRDKVLSDDERKTEFICCVSRAQGRVKLELPPQPKPAKLKKDSQNDIIA